MFTSLTHAAAALLTLADTTAPQVRIDTTASEIVVTVSGLRIPAATAYAGHAEQRVAFAWPATGWLRGYRIDVLDSAGNMLPRELLHHAGIVNPGRRQLAYPIAERLVAAGRETAPVLLPESMGVPIATAQELIAYFMLVNPGEHDIEGASLRIAFAWIPHRSTRPPRDVLPVFLSASPKELSGGESTFDVAPGVSATSAEFTLPVGGRFRAMGGHLHDYAVEIRLEDVRSGRVLARLRADRAKDGRVNGVEVAQFFWTRGGLRLEANRQYRVVALYDNPTCRAVTGAMASLAGPFAPDDLTRWPVVDAYDPRFIADQRTRNAGEEPVTHETHADAHAGHDMGAAHAGHGILAVQPAPRGTCQ